MTKPPEEGKGALNNNPMNPAKTPKGGRPIAAKARSESSTAYRGMPDANPLTACGSTSSPYRVRMTCHAIRSPLVARPTVPTKSAERGVADLRGSGEPPEHGKEREAAVGQQQPHARLRQRLDRAVEGAHQREEADSPGHRIRNRRQRSREPVEADEREQQHDERRQVAGQSRQRRQMPVVEWHERQQHCGGHQRRDGGKGRRRTSERPAQRAPSP